jgi:hypothetical protein
VTLLHFWSVLEKEMIMGLVKPNVENRPNRKTTEAFIIWISQKTPLISSEGWGEDVINVGVFSILWFRSLFK